MRNSSRAKNLLKALLVFGTLTAFAASCIQQSQRANVTITSSETPDPAPERVSTKTFQAFSHRIREHKQFACTTCHQREGRSLKIEFAGHESCIGCHLNQFTSREDQVMCSICHSNLKSDSPPVKTFPATFIEGFNMKFDHAAHTQGRGRPANGCASCHNPSGPGQTIPAGFQAHTTCYACHTAESKIGSCNVCHQIAPYSRTLQSNYSFKFIFRHGDHTERQGVSCNECHAVSTGTAQSRQVSMIALKEHNVGPGNNCFSCHNGSRAFGSDVNTMTTCTRCHKGSGFKTVPGSTGDNAAPASLNN